jgi:hypothetical protein
MSYHARSILIASALAVTAAIFMLVYVSKSEDKTAEIGSKLVKVFVAGEDIDEGTPGSSLASGALVEKRVPDRARVPGAITARNEVAGLVATQEILAGEQVTRRRFGPLAATGVLTEIRSKQRAIQIAGDPSQVLEGTLKSGDLERPPQLLHLQGRPDDRPRRARPGHLVRTSVARQLDLEQLRARPASADPA